MDVPFFPVTKREAEKAGIPYSSAQNKSAGFPTRLRKLREDSKVSQAVIAREIGVSKSTVALWETGDTVPDARGLADLAQYFEVSGDFLVGLTDYPTIDLQGYNMEDMGFSPAAVEYLAHISSAANMAKRGIRLEGLGVSKADQFELLDALLGKPGFYDFLSELAAYVQLDTPGWPPDRRITLTVSNGAEASVIAKPFADAIWNACADHLREIVDKLGSTPAGPEEEKGPPPAVGPEAAEEG